MILADTSVWIDHYRYGNSRLTELLLNDQIVTHELIIQELACGNLKDRKKTLAHLANIRCLGTSSHDEIMQLIEIKKLQGTGLGPVDAHLLSACLFANADLFTLDKSLKKAWEICKG